MMDRLLGTAYHEAGHGVVKTLEERLAGPLEQITIIPRGDVAGSVLPAPFNHGRITPQLLRAQARVGMAGAIAQRIAGHSSLELGPSDMSLVVSSGMLHFGERKKFIRECLAGTELCLRLNWTAVTQVADWLLGAGTLEAPYAANLVRLALERPQRPFFPDTDTFLRLAGQLEDVPEFAEQLHSAVDALAERAA